MYEHTKFRHAIRRAEWDNNTNVWAITVENLETGEIFVDHAEVFLNLGGNLKYATSLLLQCFLVTPSDFLW